MSAQDNRRLMSLINFFLIGVAVLFVVIVVLTVSSGFQLARAVADFVCRDGAPVRCAPWW